MNFKKLSYLLQCFLTLYDLVKPIILSSLASSLNKSSPRTLSVLSSYKVCHAGQQRYRNLFFAQSSTYGNPDSNRGLPEPINLNSRNQNDFSKACYHNFEVHFFVSRSFFQKFLSLYMVIIQERVMMVPLRYIFQFCTHNSRMCGF